MPLGAAFPGPSWSQASHILAFPRDRTARWLRCLLGMAHSTYVGRGNEVLGDPITMLELVPTRTADMPGSPDGGWFCVHSLNPILHESTEDGCPGDFQIWSLNKY